MSERDEFAESFRDMVEIPFTDDLRQRVLMAIHQGTDKDERRVAFGRTPRWQAWLASVGGVAIAAVMLWAVSSWTTVNGVKVKGTAAPMAVTKLASNDVQSRRVVPFGLQNAPVSVSNVGLGSEGGYPDKTYVMANLTNLGTGTVREGQVFGVLWFSNHPNSHSLTTSNWASFVDFSLTNGSKQLAPGASGAWSFRPIGAPMQNGHLAEAPHLVFYHAGLVSPSQADALWPQAHVGVSNIRFAERKHWTGGQSFQVTTTLTNRSSSPLYIPDLLGIIWFSPGMSSDWTAPNVVRFLATPIIQSGPDPLPPGGRVNVYFRLIGSDSTDFIGMIPHVAMIGRG